MNVSMNIPIVRKIISKVFLGICVAVFSRTPGKEK